METETYSESGEYLGYKWGVRKIYNSDKADSAWGQMHLVRPSGYTQQLGQRWVHTSDCDNTLTYPHLRSFKLLAEHLIRQEIKNEVQL